MVVRGNLDGKIVVAKKIMKRQSCCTCFALSEDSKYLIKVIQIKIVVIKRLVIQVTDVFVR